MKPVNRWISNSLYLQPQFSTVFCPPHSLTGGGGSAAAGAAEVATAATAAGAAIGAGADQSPVSVADQSSVPNPGCCMGTAGTATLSAAHYNS